MDFLAFQEKMAVAANKVQMVHRACAALLALMETEDEPEEQEFLGHRVEVGLLDQRESEANLLISKVSKIFSQLLLVVVVENEES